MTVATKLRTFASHRIALPLKDPRLARAIRSRFNPLEQGIEEQRVLMLADGSPLVDGSLGPAGLYDEGVTVEAACRVSKPHEAARYLHSIASAYRPKTVIELGTNVGISSAYLASAGGSVTTLESSPYRLRLAKRLHAALGLSNIDYVRGLFTDTLEPTLKKLPPIDLAFIDGHHQYQPTLDYFSQIAAHSSPGCVFIFDDIGWSDGMKKAWSEIKPKFRVTAEVAGMGICLADSLDGKPGIGR